MKIKRVFKKVYYWYYYFIDWLDLKKKNIWNKVRLFEKNKKIKKTILILKKKGNVVIFFSKNKKIEKIE